MTPQPTVVIIGAGPAGLTLGCLLAQARITTVVLEHRSRQEVEARGRGGLLSVSAVDILTRAGLADGLLAHGALHDAIEVHFAGRAELLKLSDLADGAAQRVYPQQLLVADLARHYEALDGVIHWSVRDVALRRCDSSDPEVYFRSSPTARYDSLLVPDFVAGCDGWHGISRQTIAVHQTLQHKREKSAWLAGLARTAPSTSHVVYGIHGLGLGLHSPRTPVGAPAASAVTRFYLSGPAEELARWDDARIWDELEQRLGCADPAWRLLRGPWLDPPNVMAMTSTISAPMLWWRLLLVGDAAHRLTPVAAKGVSLAVHDAAAAAAAIIRWVERRDEEGLRSYSATCLRRVWQVAAFCDRFSALLHPANPFELKLTETWLNSMVAGGPEARKVAHDYLGTDQQ